VSDGISIKKLLEGVEVEWKPLGEVVVRTKGTPITATQMKILDKPNAPVKIFAGGKTIAYFDYDDLPQKDINTFPSIIVKSRGVIEFEYYDKPFSHKNEMWSYHSEQIEINIKFIYYFLKTQEEQLRNKATSMGAFPQIAISDTEKIKIPIPPLNVQSEIVRILDNFTELTAELTAELRARKKQYSYYRDKLLSFEDGEVEFKSLGEVAQYSKARISSDLLNNTNYVGVDNLLQNRAGKIESNYVPTEGNSTKFVNNDILIGNIRPYLKKIWFADCEGGTNGDVLVIHLSDKTINPRFLFQVLSDDRFFDFNMQYAKGAKMPRGNKEMILKFQIPIPPLAEQERIVSILDKFDTLTNSISEGLPKEIALRQKQYEYYRDLLLTFPKQDVEA